ncbi:hypothetical protein BJ170DRAFT_723984 [Xylariales sp. AK1849]|nr:hypothetical protein BJ170DRAFT_723984 [Xylariales sp. AK1849]
MAPEQPVKLAVPVHIEVLGGKDANITQSTRSTLVDDIDAAKNEETTDTQGSGSGTPESGETKPDPPFTLAEIERVPPKTTGKKKMVWQSEAKLFCPKNGYPHALAQEFGARKCLACGQALFRRHVVEETPINSKPPADKAFEDITYDVHIRDSGAIGWKGVLKVITELRTTHRPDKNRGSYEARYILDDGVFDNPNVGIRVHSTLIEITSPQFIQLLKRLAPYYPSIDLDGKTLHLSEPYAIIAFHAKQIEAFQATYDGSGAADDSEGPPSPSVPSHTFPDTCDKETHHDIETILSFIKENIWKDKILVEETRHNQIEPTCTFSLLWLLYEPGSTVYIESDGRLAAYVVQAVEVDPAALSQSTEKLKPYKMIVWSLDFDGRYIRRFSRHITILPFSGEKPISSLSVIPCKFQDMADNGETKLMLHNEGKRWFTLLHGGLVRYTGDNLEDPRRHVDGRVVIDCGSYHEQKRRERRRKPWTSPMDKMTLSIVTCYVRNA